MLAKRLGQPQVVGEMIAGVMLGPSLFGLLAPGAQAALFPSRPWTCCTCSRSSAWACTCFWSVPIFAAITFARAIAARSVAVLLAFAMCPWLINVEGLFSEKAKLMEASLFLGAAIAITAFPMLARIIHERGLATSPLGTLALTAGAFDDASAWCILGAGQLRRQLGQCLPGHRRRHWYAVFMISSAGICSSGWPIMWCPASR
ncbi:cation:proton antiporter [Xanthomonas oryzae]|uniref:cation:proton antiporter domain-containing protein n=1 Tax=Xanthomonas oryzae TaxID=347 RepID=UPI00211CBEEA|nr:cation:proton antiporter [Xanthomonas oryzae]